MSERQYPTADILDAYDLQAANVAPLGNGLINATWTVEAPPGERFVLQRVNDMYAAAFEQLASRGYAENYGKNGFSRVDGDPGTSAYLDFTPAVTDRPP